MKKDYLPFMPVYTDFNDPVQRAGVNKWFRENMCPCHGNMFIDNCGYCRDELKKNGKDACDCCKTIK